MASGQWAFATSIGSFAISLKNVTGDRPHLCSATVAGKIPPKISMTMTFGLARFCRDGCNPDNALCTGPEGRLFGSE